LLLFTLRRTGGSLFFFHPDHLGSGTLLTDANGNAYQFFVNLPFGETLAEQRASGAYSNVYKFTGKELDSETGLYYHGARYYDPGNSIWLSTDPLKDKYPQFGPYVYCADNPVKFVDPDGRYFIVKNAGDQTRVKEAFARTFGGDAFSFDKKGRMRIDYSKLGSMSSKQQFVMDRLAKYVVDNKNFKFNVALKNKGVTETSAIFKGDKLVGANVSINLGQNDMEAKLRDTEDGTLKSDMPNYQATDAEKLAITTLHEVGHNVEELLGQEDGTSGGSQLGTPGNDKKTVGFENLVRDILGINRRVGNLHGNKREDGSYDPMHTGALPPTGYKGEGE
jgi:RHS repeat-associated protein